MVRNAKVSHSNVVYDAVADWRQKCLLGGGSVFSSDKLWTRTNLEKLTTLFIERPDQSKRSFFEKYHDQLSPGPAEVKKLAAELYWLMQLPPLNIKPKSKRSSIQLIWSWSGDSIPANHTYLSDRCLGGIASGGTGYNNYRYREQEYAITLLLTLYKAPYDEMERLLTDAWQFSEWLESIKGSDSRQFRHMILHLLFPDDVEQIFSKGDRKKIVIAFSGIDKKVVDKMTHPNLDKRLHEIRQELSKKYNDPYFLFYSKEIKPLWNQGIGKINKTVFKQYQKNFLKCFPDSEHFDQDHYLKAEKNYKLELVDIFNKTVKAGLSNPPQNRNDLLDLYSLIEALFSTKLKSLEDKPQNLLGWRYWEFCKRISDDQKVEQLQALHELLHGESELRDRCDLFIEIIRDEIESIGESALPAKVRSFVTFFLFLENPDKYAFIKTSEIKKAMQSLTGEKLSNDIDQFDQHLSFFETVKKELENEGWQPNDYIDVQSFLWVNQSYGEIDYEIHEDSGIYEEGDLAEETHQMEIGRMSKNLILYGPPGTGKTYRTIDKALSIIDPAFYKETTCKSKPRTMLKKRFDRLSDEGRIAFVTFHQSFSYEDFIEGLKAETDDTGNLRYVVEPGVFLEICSAARGSAVSATSFTEEVSNRKIWKMSLGQASGIGAEISSECFDNDYMLLGYGGRSDFSACNSLEQVRSKQASSQDVEENKYAASCIHIFKNEIKKGDLVVTSKGNLKLQAIGEVVGDYEFLPIDDRDNYAQKRKVNWIRIFNPAVAYERLMNKRFIQKTLYELRVPSIDLDKLNNFIGEEGQHNSNQPYVLIIDEINRGNIANIFGELITLIEPSKREGRTEALSVTLPYSKEKFSVPDNLYLIGTMNTADRSLVSVDTALRRRFHFEEMMPDLSLLKDVEVEDIDIRKMVETINDRITLLYDREHTLGHSFFQPLRNNPSMVNLAALFKNEVLPLLEEYFFEDWGRIQTVLGDHLKNDDALKFFIPRLDEQQMIRLLGDDSGQETVDQPLMRNEKALTDPEAYIGIYAGMAEDSE